MNFLKNRKRSHCDVVFSEDCDERNIKRKVIVLRSKNGKNAQRNERKSGSSSDRKTEKRVNSALRSKQAPGTVIPALQFDSHCDGAKLRQKRKRNLSDVEVHELNCMHPTKKPRLDHVKSLGQQITQKELDHKIFNFVRLCRYESDLKSPTFFEKLEI